MANFLNKKAGVILRLKNVLIVVNDIERSVRFYKELFGLQIIVNQEGNVIMSEGLVLQDKLIWEKSLKKDVIPKSNMTELYFEEEDIEAFIKKLKSCEFVIEYINELMTDERGRKIVRFYDPDGNLIEVGTPVFVRG